MPRLGEEQPTFHGHPGGARQRGGEEKPPFRDQAENALKRTYHQAALQKDLETEAINVEQLSLKQVRELPESVSSRSVPR